MNEVFKAQDLIGTDFLVKLSSAQWKKEPFGLNMSL